MIVLLVCPFTLTNWVAFELCIVCICEERVREREKKIEKS